MLEKNIDSTEGKMPLEKKVVEDNVRITIHKLTNLGEYIKAKLLPEYNMPTGSNMDYDTLSSTVTNNIILDNNNRMAY